MNRVRLAGHALHPMLVVFPLGLLASSLAWDIAYLASGKPMWGEVGFWSIIAGLIGAAVAAVPGLLDWLAIDRRTRAWGVGLYHLLLNVVVLTLFVVSAALRYAHDYSHPILGAQAIGWVGIGFAIVSGWFGGELVERLGVGVYERANLDAPSSLGRSGRGPTPVTPVRT